MVKIEKRKTGWFIERKINNLNMMLDKKLAIRKYCNHSMRNRKLDKEIKWIENEMLYLKGEKFKNL